MSSSNLTNEPYYQSGDTVTLNATIIYGISGSSGTNINVTIILPKSVISNTTATVTATFSWIRGNDSALSGTSISESARISGNYCNFSFDISCASITVYMLYVQSLTIVID